MYESLEGTWGFSKKAIIKLIVISNCAIRSHGLVIRSHGLVIRSLDLDNSIVLSDFNSFPRIRQSVSLELQFVPSNSRERIV